MGGDGWGWVGMGGDGWGWVGMGGEGWGGVGMGGEGWRGVEYYGSTEQVSFEGRETNESFWKTKLNLSPPEGYLVEGGAICHVKADHHCLGLTI